MKIPQQNWATAAVTAFFIAATAFFIAAASSHPGRAAEDYNDPEAELKTFKVAEGYEVNLFAAEPMIGPPIQIQFDPAGRLWVVCSWTYPQLVPGERPNDKVIILEDTDEDGKADKATDFATGLMHPTGIALGDGGAYVGQGTELLHLRDTNGDGTADQTRVVLAGFGTGDTHHNLHTLQWGPGGELFMSQGHNSYSRVETPHGIVTLDRGGLWRFRPEKMILQAFLDNSSGPANPWGTGFDRWGQPFMVDGAGWGFSYLQPVTADTKNRLKYFPITYSRKGRLVVSGLEVYGGSHLPPDMQGAILGGASLNKGVYRLQVTDDGSGFAFQDMPPIMFSTGPTFRPVDVKVGPDGAIYVADFSNEIVGHYTFSFRDPRRDKSHGRIWRIRAKNRPLVERPKLVGVPLPELLNHLTSPENYVRDQTKRLLSVQERQKVISALAQWIKQLDVNDAEYEHHLMEALTVYEIHNFVEPSLLKKLLRARDFRARAYATRVIGHWHPNLESPLDLLKVQVMDEHPRVRLEAVVALSYIPSTRAMEIAAVAVDRPMDRFLDYALHQVVHALKPYWVPAFTSGKLTFDNNQRRIEFVLTADSSADTLGPLLAQLQSDRLTPDTREQFLKIIANVGGPAELATVFGSKTYTTAAGYDAKLHAKMLPALATADLLRKVRPAGDLAAPLASLIERPDEALRVEALKLVGVWKLEALRLQITKFAEARESSDSVRRAAIEALSRLAGKKSLELLERLSAPAQTEKVRFMAIAGLAALDLNAAARQAAEALSASSGDNDPSETFSAFLQQTGGSKVLAEVLRPKKIPVYTAKAGLRLMNSAGRQDAELLAVLNKAGEMDGEIKDLAKKGLTKEDLATLMGEVRTTGDPVRGKAIFQRPEQMCTTCHAIGGEGGHMGPDLSAIGTGMPVDFIIEKMLFPNRSVKQAYVSVVVTTKDGKEFQGYKLRENDQELVLSDVLKNEETRIRSDNIKDQTQRGSLMPAGLVNNLSRSEFRDLVRFLAGLGAPSP